MSTVQMSESNNEITEPLYFCSLCKKPFSEETSRTRHVEYCRRRAVQHRQIRPKACDLCRSAKAKCDFKDPCNRCTEKQLVCSYGSKIAPNRGSVPKQTGRVSSRKIHISARTEGDALLSPGRSEDFAPIPLDDVNDIDILDHFNATYPSPDDLHKGPAPRKNFSLPHIFVDSESESRNPASDVLAFTPGFSPYSLTAPSPLPLIRPPSSSIIHSPRPPTFLSPTTSHFLLSILNSYPRMLTQSTSLPPFIHHHGARLHISNLPFSPATPPPFLEPLETCQTIARLFFSHPSPSSTDFFWRTISTEHTHITSSLETFTLATTLTALQSTMLYGTMRVLLSGRPYAAINASIVRTMENLAARCVALTGAPFSARHRTAERGRPSWETWICEETQRRVSVVCFLIALTIGAKAEDPIANPNNHVLPASKALWEARTREEWEGLYDQQCSEGAARLETVGDLVIAKLGRGRRSEGIVGRDPVDQIIERWYAEMDGLGMMLAAVVASL